MQPCPRCGTRLLPGALACINCELPIAPQPATAQGAPATGPVQPAPMQSAPPPPYGAPPPPPPYGAPPPPYGAPPPPYVGPVPYAPGHYPQGPAPWTTNGLAVASLVLAILWLGGLGSILAIIFGHVARGQIKRRPQRGEGIALAGLIIGYVLLVASAVLYANLPRIIHSNTVQNVIVQQDIRDAASAEHSYARANATFTNDGIELRNHGFTPLGENTMYAAYNGNTGFCIVGAHTGHNTWYLYDSEGGGLSGATFHDQQTAESNCSVTGLTSYQAIN